MDYNQTLQWLQQLLGTQQSTNSNEFNQGLGLQQQALTQQGTQFDTGLKEQGREFDTGLSEQGRQFDSSTALQRVIADWQNQLAQGQLGLQKTGQEQQYGLQSTAQKAALAHQALQDNPVYQEIQNYHARQSNPDVIKSRLDELKSTYDRINMPDYVRYGWPNPNPYPQASLLIK